MHDIPSLANLAGCLELIGLDGRCDSELAIRDDDISTAIEEFGGDVVVGIHGIFGLDGDVVRAASSSRVNWDK